VYGDPMIHPQPESYWGNVNPIGPRACYDEGKRVAETMMYAYRNQGAFGAVVLFCFVLFCWFVVARRRDEHQSCWAVVLGLFLLCPQASEDVSGAVSEGM
jgi:nucleoside-diphosphate-sugar epimerase